MKMRTLLTTFVAASVVAISAISVQAESVKIGFANEVPWAYPGENSCLTSAPMGPNSGI